MFRWCEHGKCGGGGNLCPEPRLLSALQLFRGEGERSFSDCTALVRVGVDWRRWQVDLWFLRASPRAHCSCGLEAP